MHCDLITGISCWLGFVLWKVTETMVKIVSRAVHSQYVTFYVSVVIRKMCTLYN